MSCRKNQANMTALERQKFVNAVLALKNSVPSQMGLTNRYDDYVQIHMDAMNGMTSTFPGWAHRGPAFLPWHRYFIRQFELDLQAVDPEVSLPYWDWTVNNSADPTVAGSPWTTDFLGGNGRDSDGRVMDGPFAFDSGNWTLNIAEDGATDLRRRFGTFPNVSTLPTPNQVTNCLGVTPYYVSPWRAANDLLNMTGVTQPSFCNRLEGWYGSGSIHNRVHLWVAGGADPNGSQSGSMFFGTSPNDPAFFLHHCNIDRLWAVWQQQHPTEDYQPNGIGPEVGPVGHNLNDSMQPWGGTVTPASTLDHRSLGYWYDTDPPEVNLLTPSIAFTDIPEGVGGTGVTTYRAVMFEVMSCDAVTLEITAGPTAGFTAPLGSSVNVPASESGLHIPGRVWIAYTSAPGSNITGSVTIRAVQGATVIDTWVINLSANTIPRPKSAVVLVLDRSGSMTDDAGDGTQKITKLRESLSIFVNLMQQGDGLGIVRFDHEVNRLMSVIDVGPIPATPGSGREQAEDIRTTSDPAKTLDPRGATSIGGGVAEARQALNDVAGAVPPYVVQAMLVLTDGNENTPPMIDDVAASGINANTFAIGFGTASNVSALSLSKLASNTGGYLLITGAITPGNTFRLTKYFLQILAGITNATVVVDPQGDLVYGAVHRIPFTLTEADMGADIILLSPAPYYIDFKLETPEGKIIDAGAAASEPAVEFVMSEKVSYYRISLPALASSAAGSHAGLWHAVLSLFREPSAGVRFPQFRGKALPYSLLVHAYSNLRFEARTVQKSLEPGAEAFVTARLTEYDVPVERRARVWAEVTGPDGSSDIFALSENSAGQFEGKLRAAIPGIYTLRLRASGRTFRGRTFYREQTLTVVTFAGGDQPPKPGRDTPGTRDAGDDRLCRLLECLLSDAVISKELAKELEARGINLKALRKCVKKYCQPTDRLAIEGRELEGKKTAQGLDVTRFLAQPEVQQMLSALQREVRETEGGPGFAGLVLAQPRNPENLPQQMVCSVCGGAHDESMHEAVGGGHTHTMSGTSGMAHHGPMFDLSAEDKAAAEEQPPASGGGDIDGGIEGHADEHGHESTAKKTPKAAGPQHHGPMFGLSAEDMAAGESGPEKEAPPKDKGKSGKGSKDKS